MGHSAYVQRVVTVHYRWHPLHKRSLPVVGAAPSRPAVTVEVAKGVWREVPLWMTDEVACMGISEGPPLVSLEALLRLRELLDAMAASGVQGRASSGRPEEEAGDGQGEAAERPDGVASGGGGEPAGGPPGGCGPGIGGSASGVDEEGA
jgi:hypothetical protein